MTAPTSPIQQLSALEWVFLLSELLVTVLGLGISYIAYIGYRRNDSRPMLLFCLGFVLVVGVPAAVGAGFVFVGVGSEWIAGAISQGATVAGLVLILVALRIRG
jgi:hypothetical protein